MIDTHAHIDTTAFDLDRDEVITRSATAGVDYIIIPGIEPDKFTRILNLTEQYKNIYCGIGVHPHHAHQVTAEHLGEIGNLADLEKVVAIGEIGLDYYYDFCSPYIQKKIFRSQLKIAKKKGLPVIIHNRDSDTDLMNILNDEQDGNLKGVLHCFSGDIPMMHDAVTLDFHISFTGNITFKKSAMDDLVKETPLNRILLETDSPYMTPVPHRGKRNEPAFVRLVAEKISEIKQISIDEVIKMTSQNAKKLFNLNSLIAFLIIFSGLIFINPVQLSAQDNEVTDEITFEEELPNPYNKGLGFGFNIGTNTIVENQYYKDPSQNYKELDKSISYEGVFFWGGTINYALLDYLYIEATYTYSKNTKITLKSPDLGPNIHQVVELTSQWIINPRSKIAFYGMGGISFFNNVLNQGRAGIESKDSPIGFNFGLGFRFQIPVQTVGIFDVVAEWRLNWAPGRVPGRTFWDRDAIPDNIENTKFFSMPRAMLVFYPEALRFLSLD